MSMKSWWTKSRIAGIGIVVTVSSVIVAFAIRDLVKIERTSLDQKKRGAEIFGKPVFKSDLNSKMDLMNTEWNKLDEHVKGNVASIIDVAWLTKNISDPTGWLEQTKSPALVYTQWDSQNTKYVDGVDAGIDGKITENFITEIQNYISGELITKYKQQILDTAKRKDKTISSTSKISNVLDNAEKVLFGKSSTTDDFIDRIKKINEKFER